VLNGAKIGKQCIIGAGALVTGGMVVPDQSLVMGAPAKIIRSLRPEEIAKMADGAQGYQARAVRYRRELQEVKG